MRDQGGGGGGRMQCALSRPSSLIQTLNRVDQKQNGAINRNRHRYVHCTYHTAQSILKLFWCIFFYVENLSHSKYLKFFWTFPISGKPRPRNGKLWTGGAGLTVLPPPPSDRMDSGNCEVRRPEPEIIPTLPYSPGAPEVLGTIMNVHSLRLYDVYRYFYQYF